MGTGTFAAVIETSDDKFLGIFSQYAEHDMVALGNPFTRAFKCVILDWLLLVTSVGSTMVVYNKSLLQKDM